ncbi:MAG TPA: glycerophosphodiester phosphodiesterase family protein [Lacisediminihabitans sp.]|uniref:glycerophosphodiester phosphodiesterase family protein n=1 Tax=Lacisediminihabitans sp. TaxID=2787631 RepID=UPI002ED9BFE8
MTPHPIVIAHRGASGYRPEHTRAAYELAFALGADAVEPDIVATKDRVLVVRHENEISGTTDVSSHPEFADRRTTKTIDGEKLSGWFTEDFTWAELSTLRARERLPKVRPANVAFDDVQGILRLGDLLGLLETVGRPVTMVAEIKHATYFASIGMPLGELFAAELTAAGWAHDDRLVVESFEKSALLDIRERGIGGRLVYLIDAKGAPADGGAPYAECLTETGLTAIAAEVDGISVHKRLLLPKDAHGLTTDLVARAHAAGLLVFCWTLRAENKFLSKDLRRGGAASDFGSWPREFALLMATGLDGVFADQPDLAIEARGRL